MLSKLAWKSFPKLDKYIRFYSTAGHPSSEPPMLSGARRCSEIDGPTIHRLSCEHMPQEQNFRA